MRGPLSVPELMASRRWHGAASQSLEGQEWTCRAWLCLSEMAYDVRMAVGTPAAAGPERGAWRAGAPAQHGWSPASVTQDSWQCLHITEGGKLGGRGHRTPGRVRNLR